MKKNSKNLLWLLVGTVLAMLPGYLIRYKESIYMLLYNKFSTYPGDLWNFFANYLSQGLHYPPEYPAGLRFFYEIMGFYKYHDYTWFFTVNALILALFAAGITYLLWKIICCHSERSEEPQLKTRSFAVAQDDKITNLWYFWIFAPSFLFYGSLNYDLPVIFLIVLACYLFIKEKYYGAITTLAIGMVMKVFPVFLLPIFILKSPKKDRINLLILFFAIVIVLNLPYMIENFNSWVFPYTWQISSNLSTGPDQGTYWWIIYPLTGKLTGWLSLLVFAGLYIFTYKKLQNTSFFNLCLAVILLFLLTDRIYSPQYSMYMLPFLVLANYKIDKRLFYVAEIPNVIIVFCCFFLKTNPLYLQIFVFIRYIALIGLYLENYKISRKQIASRN